MTPEQGKQLKAGDVVQLSPKYQPDVFGGAFMVVTEPKEWGAQGYCHTLKGAIVAYIRPKFEYMDYIGKCAWLIK